MPQYYQDQQRAAPAQQRPLDSGSVRQARERAEALTQGRNSERARPIDPRWASSIVDDGRHYTSGAATRPAYSNAGPARNTDQIQPPPAVWRTTPYSSAHASPASSVEDLSITPSKQRGRGELAQDFRFPQVPKPSSASPRRQPELQKQQQRQQQAPQPSPQSPAWPLPKPSRDQIAKYQPPVQRLAAGRVTPLAANPPDRESVYSKPSEPGTSPAPQTILRQASQGKRGKPVLMTIGSPEMREVYASPKSPQEETVGALSAAISNGSASNSRPHAPNSPTNSSPIRMPFSDDSPPRSPITEQLPLEPPRIFQRSPTDSDNSVHSYKPLLGAESRPGMSDRIPSSRRPPRLNIEAVREAESRGSTTSLAELIRRATKLASNLDRGKTASRLGMLDMFASSEKPENKHASGDISDMLSAFPSPGMTPTSLDTHDQRFPPGASRLRNAEFAPHDSELYQSDKPNGRRCCGMSLTAFFVVLFILVILIAAAVVVPIFLIVVPRMQHSSSSLASCSTSHVCQNMGISVVNDDQCSCVCTDGYTGDHCQLPIDAECMTTDVTIDGHTYDSATAGSSIPDILSGASKTFSIPLNNTVILSLFAANNLSCVTENSLVNFNVQTQSRKRFLPIRLPHMPMPTSTPKIQTVKAREPQSSTVASSNGIVFAATTTFDSTPSSTATASGSQETSSAPSPSSSASPVSQKTLSFAQLVVLYVLEQSKALNTAVNAQQTMQTYLNNAGGNANGTLSVGSGTLLLSADFASFQVLWGNGSSIGGT